MRTEHAIMERKMMLSQDELQQAALVRARLAKKVGQIEANGDLTRRAADRERAKAILAAQDEMRAIRVRSDERGMAEMTAAYKAAFGIRSDRSGEDRAYRDSLGARSPGPEETAMLFGQAQARGDELALTALAEYAWTQRHNPLNGSAFVDSVLEPYGASKPAYDDAIMTLLSEENPDRMTQLRDKLQTEITQPSDLRGDLRSLAADEGGSADAAS